MMQQGSLTAFALYDVLYHTNVAHEQ